MSNPFPHSPGQHVVTPGTRSGFFVGRKVWSNHATGKTGIWKVLSRAIHPGRDSLVRFGPVMRRMAVQAAHRVCKVFPPLQSCRRALECTVSQITGSSADECPQAEYLDRAYPNRDD